MRRPTRDDVSITRDGRRLDSKDVVLTWWAEVAAEIEAEEAARRSAGGSQPAVAMDADGIAPGGPETER